MTFLSKVVGSTTLEEAIEQGKGYNISGVFEVVSSPVEIVIDNSANPEEIHGSFGADVDENCIMRLFEAPVFTGSPEQKGTMMPVINLNRSSVNTTLLAGYHTPTLTSDGTELHASHLPTGAGSSVAGTGGTDGFPNGGEFILAANTVYLIRVSFGAATANIGGNFTFHEPL